MPFDPPRWWWTGFFVALALLAVGGALGAVEQGMRDNYTTDGCGFPWGGPRPADDPPEGVDCSAQRLNMGIVDALSRATFAPGIAMAILAGVYLLGSAIAIALGGGKGEKGDPGGNRGDRARKDPPSDDPSSGAHDEGGDRR